MQYATYNPVDGTINRNKLMTVEDIYNMSDTDAGKRLQLRFFAVTGITDKHGTLLVEGDVVRNLKAEMLIVEWSDAIASFHLRNMSRENDWTVSISLAKTCQHLTHNVFFNSQTEINHD